MLRSDDRDPATCPIFRGRSVSICALSAPKDLSFSRCLFLFFYVRVEVEQSCRGRNTEIRMWPLIIVKSSLGWVVAEFLHGAAVTEEKILAK